MRVLVTGGAGYIGSVASRMLAGEGHEVLVLDNLARGHRRAVADLDLEVADLEDPSALGSVCSRFGPEACMHFAADSLVGESMVDPLKYFRSNVAGSINLAAALVEYGCRGIVFSSTAAVYGDAETVPITETHPKRPVNFYGLTKYMFEQALCALDGAGQLKCVCLRYFNAAGADVAGDLGEDHHPETHLIPRVIAAALDLEPRAEVFGTDYPTADGTCVRDYIHVLDLARAHVLALEYLEETGGSGIFNLGNGSGFSVAEVIETVRKVSGREFEVAEGPRREGDPPVLVASSDKIRDELGWRPEFADLESIVSSAWEWHSLHPTGYDS
ncbi:MAG: UDP-glucose 4-epimerase GalE [Actinomycetota bacterium]